MASRLKQSAAKLLAELDRHNGSSDLRSALKTRDTYDLLVLLMSMSEELGEAMGSGSPSPCFQLGLRTAILEELDDRIVDNKRIAARRIQ